MRSGPVGARLTPVEVDENLIGNEPEAPQQQQTQTASALTSLLFVSLRALSQRAVIALGNLFMAASAASAWWLFYVTLPDPSPQKLIGLALYGGFILALNFMLRRK
jgi:hypothetical protein